MLKKPLIKYLILAVMIVFSSWLFPYLGVFNKYMYENNLDRLIDMRFTHNIHGFIDLITTIYLMITLTQKSMSIHE